MNYKAKSIHVSDDEGFFFSFVDQTGQFHAVDLNVDQLVLMAAQAMRLIQSCDIKRRNLHRPDSGRADGV